MISLQQRYQREIDKLERDNRELRKQVIILKGDSMPTPRKIKVIECSSRNSKSKLQCAKKVLFNSPELVDFPVGLKNFIHVSLNGPVPFLDILTDRLSKARKTSRLSHKYGSNLPEEHPRYSIFFAPWSFICTSIYSTQCTLSSNFEFKTSLYYLQCGT